VVQSIQPPLNSVTDLGAPALDQYLCLGQGMITVGGAEGRRIPTQETRRTGGGRSNPRPASRAGSEWRRGLSSLERQSTPIQDRRCGRAQSLPEVRAGPSTSYARAITPWRRERQTITDMVSVASFATAANKFVVPVGRRQKTKRLIGSRRQVRGIEPPADSGLSFSDLFDASKPPAAAPYKPSHAVVHQHQCYESEIRPWRHSHHSSLPSPPYPRPAYRPASRGVLKQPKPRQTAAVETSVGLPMAPTMASVAAHYDNNHVDSGLRRFMAHEQISKSLNMKVPTLGVSASFLENFLAVNAEQVEGDGLELNEQKVQLIFEHYDHDKDGLLCEVSQSALFFLFVG
jgi:hypothetical protein